MHLSLYRKYRPQSFADLVGQAHVTQTLKRAVAEHRVAHAFLFSGPRGTGKTSSARILAKALNCEKGGPEPCNECSSCLQVTEGSSLDVVEIDAASHGSVDDARDLREKVAYAPVSGRWKVYIVDECHMLSPAANNALLKVLEEPPEHVVFVFATTEPQKVLRTLVDRCQRYDFRAVSAADIADRIRQVCDAEGIWVDEAALSLIAARAAGSVRDGLSLLDQLRSFAGDKITPEAVAELLGQLPEDLLFEVIDLASERDAGGMFAFADRLIRSGSDVRLFSHSLVAHLRSLFLVLHAPAAQEILDISDERLERLQAQANHLSSEEVLRMLDLANQTQLQLREGIEGRLALEVALARMARPDLHATPAGLLARLERLERAVAGDPQAPSVARPPEPQPAGQSTPTLAHAAVAEHYVAGPATSAGEAPIPAAVSVPGKGPAETEATSGGGGEKVRTPEGPIDIEKVQRAWPLILEGVKRRKISFRAMLLPARPVAYRGNELILEFGPRSRFHKDQVAVRASQIPLLEAFEEILGERPVVRCVLGEESSEPVQGARAAPSAESRDDQQGDHPGAGSDNAVSDQPGARGKAASSSKPGVGDLADGSTAAIDLIREAFAGAEVVDE